MFLFIIIFLTVATIVGYVCSRSLILRYYYMIHLFVLFMGIHILNLTCNPFFYEKLESCNTNLSVFGNVLYTFRADRWKGFNK
jgi:hypothetical protein